MLTCVECVEQMDLAISTSYFCRSGRMDLTYLEFRAGWWCVQWFPTVYTGQSICPANYRSKILGLGSKSSIFVVCLILLVLLLLLPSPSPSPSSSSSSSSSSFCVYYYCYYHYWDYSHQVSERDTHRQVTDGWFGSTPAQQSLVQLAVLMEVYFMENLMKMDDWG